MTSLEFITGALLMTLSASPLDAADARNTDIALTDFTADRPDFGWFVVNDTVMGGRSEGDFEINQGVLVFAGRTNTRGGGFSSIRTRSFELDLSEYAGIRLKLRADGRRYTWRLTTNARWRGRQVSYWADFETSADSDDQSWETVDVPFSRFVPRFRGQRLNGPELTPDQITGMGLMIYDNQDGPFELRLSSVHAYSAEDSGTSTR